MHNNGYDVHAPNVARHIASTAGINSAKADQSGYIAKAIPASLEINSSDTAKPNCFYIKTPTKALAFRLK